MQFGCCWPLLKGKRVENIYGLLCVRCSVPGNILCMLNLLVCFPVHYCLQVTTRDCRDRVHTTVTCVGASCISVTVTFAAPSPAEAKVGMALVRNGLDAVGHDGICGMKTS